MIAGDHPGVQRKKTCRGRFDLIGQFNQQVSFGPARADRNGAESHLINGGHRLSCGCEGTDRRESPKALTIRAFEPYSVRANRHAELYWRTGTSGNT